MPSGLIKYEILNKEFAKYKSLYFLFFIYLIDSNKPKDPIYENHVSDAMLRV